MGQRPHEETQGEPQDASVQIRADEHTLTLEVSSGPDIFSHVPGCIGTLIGKVVDVLVTGTVPSTCVAVLATVPATVVAFFATVNEQSPVVTP